MVLGTNRGLTRGLARFVAAPFVWLRVPPNVLTVVAFLLSAVPAWLAYDQRWLWAGIALLLVSAFDMIDGAVARALGRETPFGGYLDSVLDRASDIVVLFGVGLGMDTKTGWIVVGGCVLTSFLTSYARARLYQDAQAPPGTWGQVFERPERIIFLGAALMVQGLADRAGPETDLLVWLLLIYAALGLWTVLARLGKVRAILDQTRK